MNRAAAFAAIALGLLLATRSAQADLKIGLILPMSGPFSAYGKQIEHGVRLYLAQHGDRLAGQKVELLLRDDTGIAPEVDKRLAQELVVKDNVDILAGFGLTPSAFAAAPIATEAKKPMIVMNAATSAVSSKSPYIVRVSMTLPQNTAPIASWAAKQGIRKVITVVSDYGPGHDAEAQFKATFAAGGGTVIDGIRTPAKNPDFAPFLQRIKDQKPDAVFLFVPAGEQGVAFMKGFAERGLGQSGIKLIATGDLTDEDVLDAIGDAALGIVTSFHYADAHKSPENASYTAAYAKAYPADRPNFMSVGGYDGMRLVDLVLAKTGGSADADKFVEAAKGLKWTSPRGPLAIDPATRDPIQNIYIRRVERVGGRLVNVEIDLVPDFKDPSR